MSAARRRAGRGFTLLEVLVALLLLALALVAAVRTAGLEARALNHVRATTLAQWVASNVLAEIRLGGPLPARGEAEGRSEMGRQSWRWRLRVFATDQPGLHRLEVQVFPDREGGVDAAESVLLLTGFVQR